MARELFLWIFLCVSATSFVLLYAPDLRESDEVLLEEASNPERGNDTLAFISQLQEPWNFFRKEVYRDFFDQNALQSNGFDNDTLFDAQVIRLYQKEDFDEVLLQLRNYENLEALSLVECRLGKTQFEDLVTILKSK